MKRVDPSHPAPWAQRSSVPRFKVGNNNAQRIKKKSVTPFGKSSVQAICHLYRIRNVYATPPCTIGYT